MRKRMLPVGAVIRTARQNLGWNQVGLAYRSGVGIADVSRIENDKLTPSRAVLKRLADALQLPRHEVLGDEQEAEAASR